MREISVHIPTWEEFEKKTFCLQNNRFLHKVLQVYGNYFDGIGL